MKSTSLKFDVIYFIIFLSLIYEGIVCLTFLKLGIECPNEDNMDRFQYENVLL